MSSINSKNKDGVSSTFLPHTEDEEKLEKANKEKRLKELANLQDEEVKLVGF